MFIAACWDLQRNLPSATGSGSTKTAASGWAAFWLCEHLLSVIEIPVWCLLGKKKVTKENENYKKRKKKKKRKQRYQLPNTSVCGK